VKIRLLITGIILLILVGIYTWISSNTSIAVRPIETLVDFVDTQTNKGIEISIPSGQDVPFPLKIQEGYTIRLFANLGATGSPRVIAFDENDVLVTSLTSKGKIVALPDYDADGIADSVKEIVSGLKSPHGIVFYNNYLYVAETDKVTRYNYNSDNYTVTNPVKIAELPSGGGHFTRTIKIFENYLFISVGSSCNVCIESNDKRSTILRSNLDGSNLEVYATGLRNTVFFVFDKDGRILGNDMGRDLLGDNLPPDELNLILPNTDYGWPWCYGLESSTIRDIDFQSDKNKAYCQGTKGALFGYPAHTAPLGLAVVDSPLFLKDDQNSILTALHGSWNSTTPVGYKVVKLVPENSQLYKIDRSDDFITGWISDNGKVIGRPVDLAFDRTGQLFITDDKANLIYRVYKNQ
jgi:glucose/arabinose dehydrogenase